MINIFDLASILKARSNRMLAMMGTVCRCVGSYGNTQVGQILLRFGFHACYKHPMLLLPSSPDKVWALRPRGAESVSTIAHILARSRLFRSVNDYREDR